MKRRAPDEELEPFRLRYHPAEAKPIKEELEQWCEKIAGDLLAAEPKLPARIVDRAADIWEPLIAIADVAGSDWPARARAAASHFVRSGAEETMTPGVELLAHIKEAFGDKKAIAGKLLIDRLLERDKSPWKNIRGRPLDDRGLAKRLKQYGIKPKTVRNRCRPDGKGIYRRRLCRRMAALSRGLLSTKRHKRHKRHKFE